jgi:hypothetical protein
VENNTAYQEDIRAEMIGSEDHYISPALCKPSSGIVFSEFADTQTKMIVV